MRRPGCRLLASFLCAGLLIAGRPTQVRTSAAADPAPHPAVEAILHAFARYPLVAIAELHRNQQVHDFIVSLVNDPRFAATVDDVVVEFGSASHQDVIDRYAAGGTVPMSDLRRVWRDTVNLLVWDAPVYERFFRTVRTVNQRPHGHAIRILLADPPVDWANARREDWDRAARTRDEHAAAVIEREVLAKNQRALLIFGSGHVTRDSAFGPSGAVPERLNVAELLQTRHAGSIFLIWAHMPGWTTNALDPRLAGWPNPSLALLNGTWLGAASVGPPGSPTLEQLADGFLYLGPIRLQTTSTPPLRIYEDRAYFSELLRRDQIQGGFNTAELNELRTHLRR